MSSCRIAGSERGIRGSLDVFNLLNGNAVIIQNNSHGNAWQRPQFILPGRIAKVGIQIDF